MGTEARGHERAHGKSIGGLESLAAAASLGVENTGNEEDLDYKGREDRETSESKGQKRKGESYACVCVINSARRIYLMSG